MSISRPLLPIHVSNDFDILGYPNGGYLASVATELMLGEVPHPHPLTVSAHFLAHPAAGPAEVSIEVLDVKKSISRAALTLVQGGESKAFYVASFTDFDRATGVSRVFDEPIPPTPWEVCVPLLELPLGAMPRDFLTRFDLRVKPGQLSEPGPGQPAELEGWIALADGSSPTLSTLTLFADAFPPPLFNAVAASEWGSVPTIEYSVHLKAMPRPGPVHGRFWTRHMVGGYLEIDGELRDVSGSLVAVSRQIAKYRGR